MRTVATLDAAARLAAALPEVTEGERHGNRTWSVGGKGFAWERPFSKADIKRFGDALLPTDRSSPCGWRTSARRRPCSKRVPKASSRSPTSTVTPAVLVQLKAIGKRALREAIEDGWLACAPPALADEFLAGKRRRR